MFARATSLSATGGPSTTISFGGSGGGGGIGGGGGGITKKTSFKGGGSSAILAAAAVVGSQAFLSRDSALFQDLIGGQPTERNWKGIVCALTVIISICSMIFICILLFTPMGSSSLLDGTPMELKDVVGPAFMSPIESMEWVDDNHIAIRYGDHLELLNVNKTLPDGFATTVLLDSETLYRYGKPNAIGVTTGRRYILAGYNGNKKANRLVFRIYDIKDSFENIGPKKSGDENIQVLAWNPVGNDFAFVHENNIYYQNGPGTKEVKQITTSGNISVLNGVADWLYEEEIFQTNKALWWSKDGNELGYLTIDDTIVDKIEFSRYSKLQYPETVRLPYPKTGAQNLPKVTLNIWNKKNESKKEMEIEVRDPSLGVYLFSAKWVTLFDKNVLIAIWANRYQNHTTLTLCTFDSGKCVHNYEQRYTLGGMKLWAEPEDFQDVKSFHTDSSFFLLLPSQKPSGDIFTQIAKITVTPNLATAKVAFLSMAEYDVDKINYYDSKNNLM
uniref:Dipeptidylpeptidase IV N-terminal domain-containing protein n=1 Tax=Panagrolaimus davidi TaxID=227884 RepID=A0A914QFG2_9BILA